MGSRSSSNSGQQDCGCEFDSPDGTLHGPVRRPPAEERHAEALVRVRRIQQPRLDDGGRRLTARRGARVSGLARIMPC